jgi:phosphate transport system substrate-binding protein
METKNIIIILLIIGLGAGLPAMYFLGSFSSTDTYDVLSIGGSTTVQPIILLAEDYLEINASLTQLDIQVSGGGSGAGVSGAGSGALDLGMASRELEPDDFIAYPNVQAHPIAKDGIAVVVNVALVEVKNITMDELKAIYNGTFTHWNNVTGVTATTPISVHNRNPGSGTRATFKELVLGDDEFTTSSTNHASNGDMVSGVNGDVGGIGYCGIGYVDDEPSIKPAAVGYNSTAGFYNATETTVGSGDYPIARNLNLITNGDPTGKALWFINFILSDIGQQIVVEAGYIALA